MRHVTEIAFIDPSIDDIETIIRGLRPNLKAVVLDRVTPAARQIAHVLDGVDDLDAVHVIAHGAPGRVTFSAGEWSAATLAGDAEYLATIGRALSADGELRLWSCDTAAGAAGAAFITELAAAVGADVSAATRRIGAAARGGTWELSAFAQRPRPTPPLTAAGMAAYGGVFDDDPNFTVAAWSAIDINIPQGDLTAGQTYYVAVVTGGPNNAFTVTEILGSFSAPPFGIPANGEDRSRHVSLQRQLNEPEHRHP